MPYSWAPCRNRNQDDFTGYIYCVLSILLSSQGKMSHLKGLQRPLTPEWYNPILNELEEFNIKFVDTVESEEDM